MPDTEIKDNQTLEEILEEIRRKITDTMSITEDDKLSKVIVQSSSDAPSLLKEEEDVLELSESEMVACDDDDVLKNIDNLMEKDSPTKDPPISLVVSDAALDNAKIDKADDPILENVAANITNPTVEEKVELHEKDAIADTEEEVKDLDKQEIKQENIIESKSSISSNNKTLISEESAFESQEAIRSLIKTIEKPLTDGLSFKTGTTMEELVVEMIKPQLSAWLDKHLPNIVKHLVEKEIKKLIPKDDE